jgi:hypothetical protein
MTYEECKSRISRFLSKENQQPLIVDAQNREHLSMLIDDFIVGTTKAIQASDYCAEDGLPRVEELFHDLQVKDGDFFVTGVSSFLKLYGEQDLSGKLKEFLGLNPKRHVVIITYQCSKYFKFSDPRSSRRVYIIDGDPDTMKEIYLCNPELELPQGTALKKGINNFASAVEQTADSPICIATRVHKSDFPDTLLNISEIRNAYDLLLKEDRKTKELNEHEGTDEQWQYALTVFAENPGWDNAIDSEFGDHRRLDFNVASISQMNDERLWLYYIGLKLYGIRNNWCLNDAAQKSESLGEMRTNVYRGILTKSAHDDDYWECYENRKQLLRQIGDSLEEVSMYCKRAYGEGKDEIYYLTDNTQQEKEEIFSYLDRFGTDIEKENLMEILEHVYPDLYEYLQPYEFNNELLNDYFNEYKYQKVINKLFPEFYEKVLEQAKRRDYNSILDPRASYIEKLSKKDTMLYFIDAMGVEYLGYIKSVCNELNLRLNVSVCRCELPSITSINKEFLSEWDDDQIVSIKDIDDIKHHGKYDFDYYKNSKLPIHLIKELEVIHDVLEKIRIKLINGDIKEAIIISDHGASRLVVLHDHENIWEMAEKGEHSGRCCRKSEIDAQPEFAADAGEFWALANYDRFKGGRKANVEVHGGATLEELCVPIIRVTYSSQKIEAYIMAADADADNIFKTPEIFVSHRKPAAIKVFITEEQENVSVIINGKRYEAEPIGNNYYHVDMPDIRKAGTYKVDVYSGDNLIEDQLDLIVKREGMQTKDIL